MPKGLPGPPRKDGEPQEIGRSRGGQLTKIHAMADGKGGLRRMRLSPGQAADRAEAAALLDGLEAGCVLIADKAYDAEAVWNYPWFDSYESSGGRDPL